MNFFTFNFMKLQYLRACGVGGHEVLAGMRCRRACGVGGHVASAGMRRRRVCGVGGHVASIGTSVNDEQQTVRRIESLSESRCYFAVLVKESMEIARELSQVSLIAQKNV